VDGLGMPDLGVAGLIWALPALLAQRVPLSSEAPACLIWVLRPTLPELTLMGAWTSLADLWPGLVSEGVCGHDATMRR
jgi:hypothetical protein